MAGTKNFAMAAFLCLGIAVQASAQSPQAALKPGDISGMYTFLREGEIVEIDVEDSGQVTGFISRYGELESDRGAFLDHMFSKGKLEGNKISFTTKAIHGVRFEFKGTVERGEGKTPDAEAYYVVKGTLTEITSDQDKKETAKEREVVFKSFPQEAVRLPTRKKD